MKFDEYRLRYARLTDDEHKAAYASWQAKWPEQRHCTIASLLRFIGDHPKATVIEMGGWDGWSAGMALAEYPQVDAWLNIEICEAAARATEVTDPRFHTYVPARFAWWRDEVVPSPDSVFVASHVIEHLDDHDARDLLTTAKPLAWYIEAPLEDEGRLWHKYNGSHVLTAGWAQLEEWLDTAGYRRTWVDGDARSYSRAR